MSTTIDRIRPLPPPGRRVVEGPGELAEDVEQAPNPHRSDDEAEDVQAHHTKTPPLVAEDGRARDGVRAPPAVQQAAAVVVVVLRNSRKALVAARRPFTKLQRFHGTVLLRTGRADLPNFHSMRRVLRFQV